MIKQAKGLAQGLAYFQNRCTVNACTHPFSNSANSISLPGEWKSVGLQSVSNLEFKFRLE